MIFSPSGPNMTAAFLLQPRRALSAPWLLLMTGWCWKEFLFVCWKHISITFHCFYFCMLAVYYKETKLQKIVHFQRSKHHFQRKLINFQVHWWDDETGRDALSASYTKANYRWGKSSLDCLFDLKCHCKRPSGSKYCLFLLVLRWLVGMTLTSLFLH